MDAHPERRISLLNYTEKGILVWWSAITGTHIGCFGLLQHARVNKEMHYWRSQQLRVCHGAGAVHQPHVRQGLESELPAGLASAKWSGEIQALLVSAAALRIWTGIFFPISSKRVFSLKDTHKSYPYNNCIFCYSKAPWNIRKTQGVWAGKGRLGRKYKSFEEMVNNYLLHLWIETRVFLFFATVKSYQCVGLTFRCFSHELFCMKRKHILTI